MVITQRENASISISSKMTRGSYEIGEDGTQPSRKDNSYRSFICALLIFLVICLIILLASISWKVGKHKPETSNENEEKSSHMHEQLNEEFEVQNIPQSNKTKEKIRIYVEETTKKEWIIKAEETTMFKENIETTTRQANQKEDERKTERFNTDRFQSFTSKSTQVDTTKLVDDFTASTPTHETTTPIIETQKFFDQEQILVETVTEEEKHSTETNHLLKEVLTTIPTKSTTVLDNFENITTLSTSQSPDTTIVSEKQEPTTLVDNETTTLGSTISEKIFSATVLLTTQRPTSLVTTTEADLTESDSITEKITANTKPQSAFLTAEPNCSNAICKTASSRILSMMNHSAEPCDDFYEFACGNAYEHEEETVLFQSIKILEEQLNTVKHEYMKKFKMFYDSCTEHETYFSFHQRLVRLEELLKQVGDFQIDNTQPIDLTALWGSLILRQSMPLFDIGVDIDKQSSNFILQLSLPHQSFLRSDLENWSGLLLLKKHCLKEQKSKLFGSHINLSHLYKLYENCQGNYSNYLDSVETVIRELPVFKKLDSKDLIKEIKDIRFTIEFEVLNNLDSLPPSADILYTFANRNYELRKISDLQKHFPFIEWKQFFEILTGHQMKDNTVIQLYYAKYFKNIFSKLQKVDKRKLNNAFLAIYAYDLFLNTVMSNKRDNRISFCTDLSKKLLPDIWSNMVFSSTSLAHLKSSNQQVSNLFVKLKQRFCKSLFEAKWIDDDTKIAIVKKCNKTQIAVFEDALDLHVLNKKYADINITNFYQINVVRLLEKYKKSIYSLEGTAFSPETIFSYFLDPLSKKPMTTYSVPTIVVPIGLMQQTPLGLPDYLFTIRIGFTLGRQLARHFDPTGMQYQIHLASTAKSSYMEFVHTMKTLMDYSSPRMFEDKNISFVLNGSLSLNERIVDNTAFRLVYDSIDFGLNKDILPWISVEYSKEKIFFIAAAQELCKKTNILDFMLHVFEKTHLPPALRVENIIGNSQQFASTFMCPDGSAMDLPEKVQFPFIPEEEYEDDMQEN